MKRPFQISESIGLGLTLAISGGFMDAYSYLERGHVFANAQTGNMLLLGVSLAEGNMHAFFNYVFPVAAFAFGIFLAEFIRSHNHRYLHWRQTAVLVEAVILAIVSLIPLTANLPANALTSLACGIQVECFRKIHGHGVATTMCIGNLRSATEQLHHYLQKKELQILKKSLLYYGIILFFIIGAVIGNFVIKILGQYTILISSILLFLTFAVMFIDSEKIHSQ